MNKKKITSNTDFVTEIHKIWHSLPTEKGEVNSTIYPPRIDKIYKELVEIEKQKKPL